MTHAMTSTVELPKHGEVQITVFVDVGWDSEDERYTGHIEGHEFPDDDVPARDVPAAALFAEYRLALNGAVKFQREQCPR